MEVSGQLHAPTALTPGKCSRYQLDRRLGGPQSRYTRCGEEKNVMLPGIKVGPSSPWPVAHKVITVLIYWAFNQGLEHKQRDGRRAVGNLYISSQLKITLIKQCYTALGTAQLRETK
jgi:hypothetical protein